MPELLRRLVANEDGQDLVEYGLLTMLISLVCVGAVAATGSAIGDYWTALAGKVPAIP